MSQSGVNRKDIIVKCMEQMIRFPSTQNEGGFTNLSDTEIGSSLFRQHDIVEIELIAAN